VVDITIDKLSNSYIRIVCEDHILHELSDRFTFEVPNAKFSPAFKSRHWDGKIRLLDARKHTLYAGLIHSVIDYANHHGYTIRNNTDLINTEQFSLIEAKEYTDTLGLPFPPRDYQLRAFALAIRNRRCVLVSPTASGKSLIAYLITRYYNARTLIIVPTVSLVHQLASDFGQYNLPTTIGIHTVFGGQDKISDKQITISTWQSVYDLPEDYFESFEVVIGDEAHLFKAKSLISVMTKMQAQHRFGMTGTLDGTEVNGLVLQGLFGKIEHIVSTSELIEKGSLSDLNIKILILKHNNESCKQLVGKSYQEEIEYIISHEARNKFIRNLAVSIKGNTLILYAYVDKHGKILFELIKEKCKHNNIFFVSGDVEATVREDIRGIAETVDNAIIVASYGVFSTGINIKRLHNIIFASPTKSRVRTLQSIGRGLRLSEDKEGCKLYDIADDISYKNKKNFTLKHLIERVGMYNSEEFPYELHNIDL